MACKKSVENQRPTARPLPIIGPSGAGAHNTAAMISLRSHRLAAKAPEMHVFSHAAEACLTGLARSPTALLRTFFKRSSRKNFGRRFCSAAAAPRWAALMPVAHSTASAGTQDVRSFVVRCRWPYATKSEAERLGPFSSRFYPFTDDLRPEKCMLLQDVSASAGKTTDYKRQNRWKRSDDTRGRIRDTVADDAGYRPASREENALMATDPGALPRAGASDGPETGRYFFWGVCVARLETKCRKMHALLKRSEFHPGEIP
jgi:hypothetical protein